MSAIRLFACFVPSFLIVYYIWSLLNPSIFNYLCVLAFLLVISWTLGYYFYEKFNQDVIDSDNKIVLITGCDTGFGNRAAFKFDQLGFHVYATVLSPDGDGAKELKRKCSNRLKIVRMDVTKPDEVDQVVEQIEKAGIPLWGIVNNAGIGISVPFDWGNDIDVYKKTFDVNCFGLVRMTKRCITLLRQSKGRVVNVASCAGRGVAPFIVHYCMTKFSVRVFSDVMRQELGDCGIKVVTLEPSFYQTQIVNFDAINLMRKKIFDETPKDIRKYYPEDYFKLLHKMDNFIKGVTKSNLDDVVDCMIAGIMKKHPKLYYRVGTYIELFTVWGASHLPEILQDMLYRYLLKNFSRKLNLKPNLN